MKPEYDALDEQGEYGDDPLRAAVEKEMRGAGYKNRAGTFIGLDAAVSVAVKALLREREENIRTFASGPLVDKLHNAEKRAEAAENGCRQGGREVLEARADRDAAVEAAEKERDEWAARARAIDKDVEALIQERDEARRALAEHVTGQAPTIGRIVEAHSWMTYDGATTGQRHGAGHRVYSQGGEACYICTLLAALAEYREKWGHIQDCGCRLGPRDPRCAPEGKA